MEIHLKVREKLFAMGSLCYKITLMEKLYYISIKVKFNVKLYYKNKLKVKSLSGIIMFVYHFTDAPPSLSNTASPFQLL